MKVIKNIFDKDEIEHKIRFDIIEHEDYKIIYMYHPEYKWITPSDKGYCDGEDFIGFTYINDGEGIETLFTLNLSEEFLEGYDDYFFSRTDKYNTELLFIRRRRNEN